MDNNQVTVSLAKLKSIAQNGLEYATDPYDIERYEQLAKITKDLVQELTTLPVEKIDAYLHEDKGYATPKVDVRSVVFDEKNRLLMVKEKTDNSWALPGGWADIGYSPFEIAQKETWEEAGLRVNPVRLLAVKDKSNHAYPPSLWYTYKLFISCSSATFEVHGGLETADARFFSKQEIQHLIISTERNTLTDLLELFEKDDLNAQVFCD